MDAKLRRALDAISRNDSSGAAELTSRAVRELTHWLHRREQPTEREFLEVARKLLRTQPSMAPMLRLANEVAWACDLCNPRDTLRSSLKDYRSKLETSPLRIALSFSRWLAKKKKKWTIITYSYSSTVGLSLVRARKRIEWVECAEGRPAYEGRRMAEQLARAVIPVQFDTDAELIDAAIVGDLFVCGADAITRDGFFNKVGTESIVQHRSREGRPTVVLAETMKFWPESPFHSEFLMWTYGHPRTVWGNPPASVRVNVRLFSCAPLAKHVTVLTEKGWMTPKQVRAELKKIRISPRLKTLVD